MKNRQEEFNMNVVAKYYGVPIERVKAKTSESSAWLYYLMDPLLNYTDNGSEWKDDVFMNVVLPLKHSFAHNEPIRTKLTPTRRVRKHKISTTL